MKYSLKKLESMPTLHQGHTDDLKLETITNLPYRVWLSRMTTLDGMPYNNQVTIEMCVEGKWITVEQYEAK